MTTSLFCTREESGLMSCVQVTKLVRCLLGAHRVHTSLSYGKSTSFVPLNKSAAKALRSSSRVIYVPEENEAKVKLSLAYPYFQVPAAYVTLRYVTSKCVNILMTKDNTQTRSCRSSAKHTCTNGYHSTYIVQSTKLA